MKLRNIIFNENQDKFNDFSTKKTAVDPTTGQISWDVKYTPMISLDNNLEELYQDFKDVIKENPNDIKLEELFKAFSSLKRNIRTHISRKYK